MQNLNPVRKSEFTSLEDFSNGVKIKVENFSFYYDGVQAIKNVSMDIKRNQVTGIIGPSGCGKSTFLRSLNRMNDVILGSKAEGRILIDDKNIYDPDVDVVEIRRRVGMVFQKSNPFPKSIFDNVSYGLKINGIKDKCIIENRVIESLKEAALWDEVKDRLHESALKLSGGQQQRLCIARCLAVKPEVILFDEPLSNLDAKLRMESEYRKLVAKAVLSAIGIVVTEEREEERRRGE